MIKLDMSTALFLYLFFSVFLVLLAWMFLNFGTKQKTFSSEEKHIWHCSICALTYVDSKREVVSKCPRCDSYNQRVEYDFEGTKKLTKNINV